MDPSKTIRTYKDGVAVVTGGASGIGRAISEELVKRGCQAIIADLQSDLAEEIASKLRQSGGKVTAVKADVRHALTDVGIEYLEEAEKLIRAKFAF